MTSIDASRLMQMRAAILEQNSALQRAHVRQIQPRHNSTSPLTGTIQPHMGTPSVVSIASTSSPPF